MSEQPDYSRLAGGAASGARLRRLSERIDRESAQLYAAFGIEFEQRWFGILNQIIRNGPMTVGDIASALRLTHASISQARRSLEAKGFVHSLTDGKDARRRPIALTPKGEALTRELAGLWQALGDSAAELNAEAGDLIPLLDRLDDALAERSLLDRALAHAARP